MKALRVFAACFVAATAGLFIATATSTADSDRTTTLKPTAEGWYQPNPTCDLPLGCASVVPPPLSPYPPGTLHVGVSAAQETARTFIAFPLRSVVGTITGASLTLPLDTRALSGDASSATADLAVCLTQDPIVAVDGSFGPRPSTDCSFSAAARYAATPQPRFVVDLTPLSDGLRSATGLVVLPDSTKLTPDETWRVAFSTHDRNDAAAPPAPSLLLTVSDAPSEEPSAGDDNFFVPDLNTSLVDPPFGTGFAAPSVVDRPSAVVPPAVAPREPAVIANVRYRYKAVWLLPLVLLALVPTVVNALTKDLTPSDR